MKRGRFTEDQIIGILNEHEAGISVADLRRKHGVSDATVYKWKAKYGGMAVSEATRLKGLEDENARLKRLLADAMLETAALRDLMGKSGDDRHEAASGCASGGKSRDEPTVGVPGDRLLPDDNALGNCHQDDAVLRERLKELANARRRLGCRRLHVFLRRAGHEVNHKRMFRIYREEQLHVRRRGGRKRAMGTRAPMVLPLMPNQRWSLDFVSDQLTDGHRFRIMTVVDDCTRECLALVADTSLSGGRAARELATLFPSLHHGRVTLAAWRTDYNTEGPHSRLGWKTPAGCAQTFALQPGLTLRNPQRSAPAQSCGPKPGQKGKAQTQSLTRAG